MAATTRREWIPRALVIGMSPLLALAQSPPPQVVKIVAQRFRYTPREFRVKAGVPVLLEFTSIDFVHGFHMPDLKLRADLPPGMVTRVNVAAVNPGAYDFLCDNFCGDDHETMHGRMIAE